MTDAARAAAVDPGLDGAVGRPALSDEVIEALSMVYARAVYLSREERALMLLAFGERAEADDADPRIAGFFLALEDLFRAVAREKGELG